MSWIVALTLAAVPSIASAQVTIRELKDPDGRPLAAQAVGLTQEGNEATREGARIRLKPDPALFLVPGDYRAALIIEGSAGDNPITVQKVLTLTRDKIELDLEPLNLQAAAKLQELERLDGLIRRADAIIGVGDPRTVTRLIEEVERGPEAFRKAETDQRAAAWARVDRLRLPVVEGGARPGLTDEPRRQLDAVEARLKETENVLQLPAAPAAPVIVRGLRSLAGAPVPAETTVLWSFGDGTRRPEPRCSARRATIVRGFGAVVKRLGDT